MPRACPDELLELDDELLELEDELLELEELVARLGVLLARIVPPLELLEDELGLVAAGGACSGVPLVLGLLVDSLL